MRSEWQVIRSCVESNSSVTIPSEEAECNKRGILAKIARIYDPLGLVSPVTLQGSSYIEKLAN